MSIASPTMAQEQCGATTHSYHPPARPKKIFDPNDFIEIHGVTFGRCPNHYSDLIAQFAPGQEDCYKRLFAAESNCDPKKPHHMFSNGRLINHTEGWGICAIEKDPHLRKTRGPECSEIKSERGQVRCCVHLMRSTEGWYFGTVRRKEVNKCL